MLCSIGEKISIYRKRKNLTIKQLAKASGISEATITNYESGKTIPSVNNMLDISLVLGVSLNDLIPIDDPDAPEIPNRENMKLLEDCEFLLLHKNFLLTKEKNPPV